MAAGLNPQRMLHRMSFGLKVRTEVWQTLADFTLTGMEISMAFETAARIYRLQGNRSVEHILLEFRNAMVTGSIAETAAAYATESDRLMFTGESDIEAHRMFAAAARVGKAQLVIRQAVRSALFGPCLSLLGLIALYIVLGTRLFPAFEQAAPAAAWPTHVQILAWLSYGVAENIAVLAAGAACLAAAVTASVRMWTGLGRSWADRIPPWSLYRMQTGLTFMLLLVESGKMGRSLTTSWMLDVARASGPTRPRGSEGSRGCAGPIRPGSAARRCAPDRAGRRRL